MRSTVTHHLVGWAAAAFACALGVWIRAANSLESNSTPLLIMIGVGVASASVGFAASRLSLLLPDQISPAVRGVAIRYRRIEPTAPMIGGVLAFAAAGIYGFVAGIAGPWRLPSEYWLVQAGLSAWLGGFATAHLPWLHHMVIRPDCLILNTNTERISLRWEDIKSIKEASSDRARTNAKLKELHAAIAITVRPEARSPQSSSDKNQLQDRFHIGYLSVRNDTLVAALQHLLQYPRDRELMRDPERARELFSRLGEAQALSRTI